jgi:glutamate/tyrosine decarboxylase-like PLP-dependent enzyme
VTNEVPGSSGSAGARVGSGQTVGPPGCALDPGTDKSGGLVDASLLRRTAERAIRYLETLPDRRVSPPQDAIDGLGILGGPLGPVPTAAEEVIDLLDRVGSRATVATSGGRFFGFVVGGTLPAPLAANWLTSAWDQSASSWTTSPVAAALEDTALGWLLDVLGLPSSCGGSFVTGATMANFTALAAARHAVLQRVGWDVESDGLGGAPPITVLVSEEAHPSVRKSLGLLGLGRNRVVSVGVDRQGRMRPDAFPRLAGPAIICAQVGNVNTGSIDPMRAICELAAPTGAWVHVDGAFGLWAAADPRRAHLLDGVANADSWATDAHKWLNVPYDSGLAFVRDSDALRQAMAMSAAYLAVDSGRQPKDYTPELSRRARGVEVWAALRALGRQGLADLIDRSCRHAKELAEGLTAAGYDVLNQVVLNQVLVDFGGADITRKVIEVLQDEGTCWCGGTVWQGRVAMRISVSSGATTDHDVSLSLASMLRAARATGR